MNRSVVYLSLCFTFLAILSKSQDTLQFKTGTSQIVKIIEVDDESVKYKKLDFMSGPTYIIALDDIRSISYLNGAKETYPKYKPSHTEKTNNFSNYSNTTKPLTPPEKPYKKSGPRIGCTYIGDGTAATKMTDMGKTPFVSQLGWEIEGRLFKSASGMAAMLEFNFLLAGIEQGLIIPNGNILLGLRGREGLEIAIGPNLSPSGLGMEFMIGSTLQLKDMYFPVQLSFVPSVRKTETTYSYTGKEHTETTETGFRVSLLIGFYSKLK